MEITLGYAIAAGGILLILALINLLPHFVQVVTFTWPSFRRVSRYLIYRYLIHRHQLLGPWTLADVLIQLLYIGINSLCLGFRFPSIATAGIRAGNLSLINLVPLFLGPHLSFLADIIGVSFSTFRNIHRSAGLMSLGLVVFHSLSIFASRTAFALRGTQNIYAVVAGSSLGLIVVLSWPPLRKRFYEIFLRLHQTLAALVAISILLHVPPTLLPPLYFYVTTAGIFIVTFASEGALWLYHNGIFTRKIPIIGEVFKYPDSDENSPIQVTILLQTPLAIEAPQYINIWIPSLGIRSSMQSHPFVITSWTGKKQTNLELLIEPRHGWTKRLRSRAVTASGHNGGLGRVLFTGPHGAPVPLYGYEYFFMVASGYGIIPHLPLLERLVQGTLAREVRARRICLVWEVEDIGLYKAVCPRFNWVLAEDRKLGNSCTLAISVYSAQLSPGRLGQRGRAEIFKSPIVLQDAFESEVAEISKRNQQEKEAVEEMEEKRAVEISTGRTEIINDIIRGPDRDINFASGKEKTTESGTLSQSKTLADSEPLPVCTRTPRMLITVSASAQMRDELRLVLATSLDTDISLMELDYQPSD